MKQITQTYHTTTCLFFLLISYYIFLSDDRATCSSGYYRSILPFLAAFLLVALIIFAVRTTIVAWITLVVLLAFSSKRHRVLAQMGDEITWEVALYFPKVVIKERGLLALLCAIVIIAWLRITHQIPL